MTALMAGVLRNGRCNLAKKKRADETTHMTLAPRTVDEAVEALLKTPPPHADNGTRKGRLQDAQKRAVKRAKRERR
jgi:hypothetical protein